MSNDGEFVAVDLSACAVPSPCPTVTDQTDGVVIPPRDEAVRCVAQAFHDRTMGLYTHTVSAQGCRPTKHSPGTTQRTSACCSPWPSDCTPGNISCD